MTQEKSWFALEITVASEASEAIEFGLNELESLGTEINNLGKKTTETLCVVGYFNEILDGEIASNQLNEALKIYGFSFHAIKKIETRKIVNVDWLLEWKKHWKPTETEKFIIAPTWEKVENSAKIVIYIEPNMAFGTGTHETTRLCLRAIGENYRSEMSFLDVGTGTGILSIAAAKLKFQSSNSENTNFNDHISNAFLACDTDAASIEIAQENARLNNVDEINFYVGSISAETPAFDFVCANLTADVILPILPTLIEKTEKFLVLSGILKEQENSITDELKKLGIEKAKIETLGEWISVAIENGK